MAERQSRGRKQPRIDGGVNLQVEASIGSRAERRSGSGAAAEDGEAWSNSRGWWRGSRSAASIGGRGDGRSRSGSGFNPQTGGQPEQRGTARAEADGRSRIGGRADGELDAGGALPNSRFALFSPLPSLLSFLRSLSLPALKRCGGPRGSIGTRFPARARSAPFPLRAQGAAAFFSTFFPRARPPYPPCGVLPTP